MDVKTDFRVQRTVTLLLSLCLAIKGRISFLQLERFSSMRESYFRYFFERYLDFLKFNKALIVESVKGKTALGFDPRYICYGEKIPGIGYFWLSCAEKVKWGLEFN